MIRKRQCARRRMLTEEKANACDAPRAKANVRGHDYERSRDNPENAGRAPPTSKQCPAIILNAVIPSPCPARCRSGLRRLMRAGEPKMAQKLIEEAGEVAVRRDGQGPLRSVHENAERPYHLAVLWARLGVRPEECRREYLPNAKAVLPVSPKNGRRPPPPRLGLPASPRASSSSIPPTERSGRGLCRPGSAVRALRPRAADAFASSRAAWPCRGRGRAGSRLRGVSRSGP